MALDTKLSLSNQKFEQHDGDSLQISGHTIIFGNISYGVNKSGTYGPRSIPDVAYVTGLTSTISGNTGVVTFENGLQRDGSVATLGGILDVNTDLRTSGNTQFITFVASGRLGVGTSSPAATVDVKAATSDDTEYGLIVRKGDTTQSLSVRNDGLITASGQLIFNGITQDDSKTQVLVKDPTTHELFWRNSSSFGDSPSYIKANATTTLTATTVVSGPTTGDFNLTNAARYNISPNGSASNRQVSISTLNVGSILIQYNATTPRFEIIDLRATKKGIEYNADYSANYTNRSLVDKGYVTGLTSSLANTGDFWKISGTTNLSGLTTINSGGNALVLQTASSPNYSIIQFNQHQLIAGSTNGGSIVNGIQANSALTSLRYNHTSTTFLSSIEMSDALTVVKDANSSGMRYYGDYIVSGISRHGDLWIPSKGYVDQAISAATSGSSGGNSITVNNGLTKNADNIRLGGVLTGNTIFTYNDVSDFSGGDVTNTIALGNAGSFGSYAIDITSASAGATGQLYFDNQDTRLFLRPTGLETAWNNYGGLGETNDFRVANNGVHLGASYTDIDLFFTDYVNLVVSTPTNPKRPQAEFQIFDGVKGYSNYVTFSKDGYFFQFVNNEGVEIINFSMSDSGTTYIDGRAIKKGIEYGGNYSTGFTKHSLVDKNYVTGLTSTISSNVSNGLSKDSGTIVLGGGLTTDTTITATGSTHTNTISLGQSAFNAALNVATEYNDGFTMGSTTLEVKHYNGTVLSFDNLNGEFNQLKIGSSGIEATSNGDNFSHYAYFDVSNSNQYGKPDEKPQVFQQIVEQDGTVNDVLFSQYGFDVSMRNAVGDDLAKFIITKTGTTFTDGRITPYGIQYSGNYASTFAKHSLVDKNYVTGLTSTISTGAANGLTKNGTNIELGGTITKNTSITGFPLKFAVLTGIFEVGAGKRVDSSYSTLPLNSVLRHNETLTNGTPNFYLSSTINSDHTITGIQLSDGNIHGLTVRLMNDDAVRNITLANRHTGSTASNRFDFNRNIVLKPKESLTVWYDSRSSFWRVYNNVSNTPQVVTQSIEGSVVIDLRQGDVFILNMSGNTTFNFTGETIGRQYVFKVIKDSTEKTFTWVSGRYRFSFGTAPVLTNPTTNGSSPAHSEDIITAICTSSGRLDIVTTPNMIEN